MRQKHHIMKFFHEETDEKLRKEILAGMSSEEKADFDVFEAIWNESGNLQDEMIFNGDSAWSKVAELTAADGPVTAESENDKETEVLTDTVKETPPRILPFRRYAVAAAAVLVLIVASRIVLQETNIIDDTPRLKTFVSLESAREYAFDKMFPLAEHILLMAQNKEFEDRVYAMAGKRFDGETNVLVRDILGKNARKKRWKTVLSDFKNVHGANYYPQIFIPDYYNYQTKVGDPVIVFYLSDDAGPNGYVYTGYHIEDGVLKPLGPVDEERLKSLRVWVMSINENVDNQGRVVEAVNSTVNVSAKNIGKSGRIDKLAIYDPKESWAGGSSEVRVRAYLESWDGISSDGRGDDFSIMRSSPSPAGVPLRNFSREEIQRGDIVEVDYTLLENWDVDEFLTDGIQLVYVIFEADTWPNTIGEATYSLANGDPRLVKYSSAQEYYDVGCIFGTKAPANWHSPVYPAGIPDSQLISNYTKRTSDIFITTEEY